MRALVLSAAGLNLQTLINSAGNVGVESAWVITNNAGDWVARDPSPDLVIAVLDPDRAAPTLTSGLAGPGASPFANLDVAVRAGQAAGQGYPVLLIVPPPLPRPADLLGVVVAPCPLDNFGVLRLHLWAFVSTLGGRAHLETGTAAAQPATFDTTKVLDQLYGISASDKSAGQRVEQLISTLLSQVGAELAENPEHNQPDGRVDLAVLPARTSSDILLVEIKAGRLTEAGLAEAELQLQEYVLSRHASLGLVLYHDFYGRHWPSPRNTPSVIRMSVRELIAGLATNSLQQLISGVARDASRWYI